MTIRHTITGVAGAIALAALAGCAATPSPDSSVPTRVQAVSVPLLEEAGVGSEYLAVDRSFDTVTVETELALDESAIEVPVTPHDAEQVCTVLVLDGLPEAATLKSTMTEWQGGKKAFIVDEPRDRAAVWCTAAEVRDGATPLARVWDSTHEVLSDDTARYIVQIEVPLSEVEVTNG